MFILRSKKYWNKPSKHKHVFGDDAYLPDHITYTYGKNRIRMIYDAIVYFEPFTSLIAHYKNYKRIYFDLMNLKENFQEFREIREHSALILDFSYIKKQPCLVQFYFFCFRVIRAIELSLFEYANERDPGLLWKK